MALPKIQIVFTNHDKIFYPGENVTGYVRISTKKEIKCRGFLTFVGLSYVHLKGVKSKKSDLDQNYSTKEEYYDKRFQIIGGVLSTTNETLTAGEHSFDFDYRLPQNVPSSLDSKNGYVKHSCEVVLEISRSLITPKVKYTEDFYVNSILDLSGYIPQLHPPVVVKCAAKDIDTFFGKSGKITAKIKLGRAAYVPDENIFIDADIKNTSNLILCTAKAKLIQEIKYKVNHHSLTKSEVIGSVVKNYRAGGPTNNYDWSVEVIKVPHVPASHLHGCKIIDIQYILQFQIFSKSKTNPEIEENIPLIIGSLLPQSNEISLPQSNEKSLSASSNLEYNASAPSFEPVHLNYDFSNVENFLRPSAPPVFDSAPPVYGSAPPVFGSAPPVFSSAPPVFGSAPLYPEIDPPPYEECISESKLTKE